MLSISQPGDYYVRVTDANNCFIDSDTITVAFDSTLANVSLGPDTSLCLGYDIGLTTNLAGISSYLWNTNQTSPRILPQASGVYWVDVTSGECTVRDSIHITISGNTPTANFTAPNICFGDSAIFIDNSQNPTLGVINKWRWNFGNGLTDTTQNTSTYYSSAQSYSVSLYVETDANCSDSITKQLLVNPKPIAGFTNSLACVGDTVFLPIPLKFLPEDFHVLIGSLTILLSLPILVLAGIQALFSIPQKLSCKINRRIWFRV